MAWCRTCPSSRRHSAAKLANPWCGRTPAGCGETNHVGTAALGCPVERSSTALLPIAKPSGALLRRTAEDSCPYLVRAYLPVVMEDTPGPPGARPALTLFPSGP